ncbi:MAG: hypothetical protein RMY28_026665 [Nostoc sp. ChiSLP01]
MSVEILFINPEIQCVDSLNLNHQLEVQDGILDFKFCEKFDRRLLALKAFQDGFWIENSFFKLFPKERERSREKYGINLKSKIV